MKQFILVIAALLSLPAFADGILVDLGDNGTKTGYSKQSEQMEGGATKVYAYDWVCPPGAERPADGIVSVVEDDATKTLRLGPRQCYDRDAHQVVDMVKQYRSAYYVVGSQTGDLPQEQADHGGSGAAAAAAAAGAAAGGIYSSCTLNPFALCSGPRPGRRDAMRGCFDFVCPFGH